MNPPPSEGSTHRLFYAAVAVMLLAALLLPAVASATSPEDAWYAIAVTAYDLEEEKDPTISISPLAREGTELPAEVTIAVPKGVTILWAGEVLGGDPSLDPQLDVTVEPHEDYDVLRFTLTKSLRASIEMSMPDGWVTPTETGRHLSIEWTSIGFVDRVRMGFASPFTHHFEAVVPEPKVEVRPTDVLYSVETSPVAAGQTLRMSGDLLPGQAPELTEMMSRGEDSTATTSQAEVQPMQASSEPAEDDSTDMTWLIVGVLALLAAVIAVIAVLRMRAGNAEAGEDIEDLSEEEDEEPF